MGLGESFGLILPDKPKLSRKVFVECKLYKFEREFVSILLVINCLYSMLIPCLCLIGSKHIRSIPMNKNRLLKTCFLIGKSLPLTKRKNETKL